MKEREEFTEYNKESVYYLKERGGIIEKKWELLWKEEKMWRIRKSYAHCRVE